jgi:hypothetical protein
MRSFVPILARPEGRAQPNAEAASVDLSGKFQSSPDPKAGRNKRERPPEPDAPSKGVPSPWKNDT